MRKVQIITDSCSDLSKELLEKYHIDYAAMNTVYNGETRRARLEWTREEAHELYELMRAGKRVTTTQVPVEEFNTVFRRYLEQDCDIVYISCCVKQSGSINTGHVVAGKLMEEFPGSTIICIDSLIECNFGEFEGKSAEELQDYPVFPHWLAGEPGVEPPFGESNEAFGNRVCDGFIKIVDGLMKTKTMTSAVITHGGVIMALLSAFGLPELPMHEWMTPNGCGYTLRITPSLWMRGRKFEVAYEFPYEKNPEENT